MPPNSPDADADEEMIPPDGLPESLPPEMEAAAHVPASPPGAAVPEVRRRRRPREHVHPRARRRHLNVSPALLGVSLLLAAGGGAGLMALLGWSRPSVAPKRGTLPAPTSEASPAAPSPDLAEAVEAGFVALEEGRPLDARDRFLALAAGADPATRSASALRAAAAWTEMAAGRTEAAEGLLVAGLGRAGGGDSADARFLLGLSRLLRGEYEEAGKSFARGAALDPTRADIHLLWGETLRREGRPRESIAHFRAALRRNRQETNVGFYRLKLWLAQLQAGGETAADAEIAIVSALRASETPSGTVLLGAAARAIAAGRWPEAAEMLGRARAYAEPPVFHVTLQDPFFADHATRPELSGFFPETRSGEK